MFDQDMPRCACCGNEGDTLEAMKHEGGPLGALKDGDDAGAPNTIFVNIPADDTTTAVLPLDTTVSESLETAGDIDWFRFEPTTDGDYQINLSGGGANPLGDTVLTVYDSGGNVVAFNDDANGTFFSEVIFSATGGQVYFVEARDFANDDAGDYELFATEFVIVGDIPDDDTTTETLGVGLGAQASTIDFGGDEDWFRLDITSDGFYVIEMFGDDNGPTTPLGDTFLNLYDVNGNLIAFDDDGGPGLFSEIGTNLTAGTYYVGAAAFGSDTGDYQLSVDIGVPPTLTDTVNWFSADNTGGAGDPTVIEVYFAQNGEVFDGVTSNGWNTIEMDAVMSVFDHYERYIDVEYVITTDDTQADFRLVTSDTATIGALGYMYPNDPGFPAGLQGIGVFATDTAGWDNVTGNGLGEGGFGRVLLAHEFGHGMGLAHPHDTGGGSDVLTGVTSPFGDFGDFDLNQGVFTTMSYNDGWETGPAGLSTTPDYGFQNGIMAVDIAVLQERYGANDTYNGGNDVYVLDDTNDLGTSYDTIWDTGGVDRIVHNGSANAVIDLNDATLQYEVGGGGFVSYVDGIFGGFTIANGVVIENADGGSGRDLLVGNEADNRLRGNGGNDTVFGGEGNDFLAGNNGRDVLEGDDGNDTIRGGGGSDTMFGGNGDDVIAGQGGDDYGDGGAGNDIVGGGTGADTLLGGQGDDDVRGSGGDDIINGGDGNDTLRGQGGDDTYVFELGFGDDQVQGFEDGADMFDVTALGLSSAADITISAGGIGNVVTFAGVVGSIEVSGAGLDVSDFLI